MFSTPLDESALANLTKKTFAPDTMKKISWVVNMYSA